MVLMTADRSSFLHLPLHIYLYEGKFFTCLIWIKDYTVVVAAAVVVVVFVVVVVVFIVVVFVVLLLLLLLLLLLFDYAVNPDS